MEPPPLNLSGSIISPPKITRECLYSLNKVPQPITCAAANDDGDDDDGDDDGDDDNDHDDGDHDGDDEEDDWLYQIIFF